MLIVLVPSIFIAVPPTPVPPTPAPVAPVAQPTLPPADATLLPNPLFVSYGGGSGQDGVMFDTVAIGHIHVNEYEINCDTTSVEYFEVYTKKGSYDGYEESASDWTRICAGNVQCMGAGESTLIPFSLCDDYVEIGAGDVQAFYITSNRAVVDYTSTKTKEGNVIAKNECIALLVGKGKEYPFKKSHKKRVFNGQLDILCELPEGLSSISGRTIYPFGEPSGGNDDGGRRKKKKEKKKKKKKKKTRGGWAKFMTPRDGTSGAVCEDFDDCNDDLECIGGRCEIRI